MPGVRLFACLVAIFFAIPAAADLRDLIALPDGKTVYFRMKTGLATDSWYLLRETSPGTVTVQKTKSNLIDVSATGDVAATAFIGTKSCGFGGSTCFLQPNCQAYGNTSGGNPPDDWNRTVSLNRETFVRLDRSGKLAWIELGQNCFGPIPSGPDLHGFFDAKTLQVFAPVGYNLANRRIGRRSITNRNRALVVYYDGRLGWWTANRILDQIGNRTASIEAVTDASGCTVAYNDAGFHALWWIDLCNYNVGSVDERIDNANGTMLALSDNGRYLAFQDERTAGNLAVYDRLQRRIFRDLLPSPIQTMAVGGNVLFAVTDRDELLRLDLDSGEVRSILPPVPQIDRAAAQQVFSIACPLVCYGPVEPRPLISPGMVLFVEGRNLNQPGWMVRIGTRESPLSSASETAAWFEFAKDTPTETAAAIFNPSFPGLELKLLLTPNANAFACLGTTHQGQSNASVTSTDPARIGEVIRVWMTGFSDRIPPPLNDPGAADVLTFQPATGVTGVQYLDLRINRPFAPDGGLFEGNAGYQCLVPAVQTS